MQINVLRNQLSAVPERDKEAYREFLKSKRDGG